MSNRLLLIVSSVYYILYITKIIELFLILSEWSKHDSFSMGHDDSSDDWDGFDDSSVHDWDGFDIEHFESSTDDSFPCVDAFDSARRTETSGLTETSVFVALGAVAGGALPV